MNRFLTLLFSYLSIALILLSIFFLLNDKTTKLVYTDDIENADLAKNKLPLILRAFKSVSMSGDYLKEVELETKLQNNSKYFYYCVFYESENKLGSTNNFLEISDTTQIFDLDIIKLKSPKLITELHQPDKHTNYCYKGNIIFKFSSFKSFHLSNLEINGELKFNRSIIDSVANFSYSSFASNVSFISVIFNKAAYFNNSTFNSLIYFNGSSFKDELNLSNLNLTQKTRFNFNSCSLPDLIDFSSNGKIYNEIDLTVAHFNNNRHSKNNPEQYKPHYINLFKSDISKFHLDYTHFKLQKKYLFQGKYVDLPYDEMCSIYEGLLNNFKTRGQQESYELLDIEYKDYKWQHSKTPWMSDVERLWWNYGYDKHLIFKWAIVFLLSFTLITFLFLKYFNSVYKLQGLTNLDQFSFSNLTIKTLFIKWWFAFVYSAAIFFGLTLKIENIEYRKFWGTLYIVFMYTLGIVCLAYMANFVIQN